MRMLAAWLVLLTHSAALLGQPAVLDTQWAAYGLGIFFVLSGALVSGSAQRSLGGRDFFLRRIRRLVPAYLACSLGVVLIVWPLCSALPWAYTLRPDHWIPVWIHILSHGAQWSLPETFQSHLFASANGSVWTLPYEGLLYLGLGLAWFTFLKKRQTPWIAPALIWAGTASLCLWDPAWLPESAVRIAGFRIIHLLHFLGFFAAGWFLASFRPSTKVLISTIVPLLALRVLLANTDWTTGLDILLVPLGVMAIGRFEIFPGRSLPDWSYGFYLWGWPVQQTWIHWHPDLSTIQLTLLATITTLPIAALSWIQVERPWLRRSSPSTLAPT
jgi:peptidoglycan/LPS O-acetylase OafA/YrhL